MFLKNVFMFRDKHEHAMALVETAACLPTLRSFFQPFGKFSSKYRIKAVTLGISHVINPCNQPAIMGFFDIFTFGRRSDSGACLNEPLDLQYTPDAISALGPRDIFVFGSNLAGSHLGGAARTAVNRFGAVMGQGEGLQGQSYAIPTMQGGVHAIKPYVDRFIEFAKKEQTLTFYVTKIGCGIAGFQISEIAPLFKDAIGLENIRLPKEFAELLDRQELIHHDTITHAYGVSRTFADVVISLNKQTPFKSAQEALSALHQYFHRFIETGDDIAFVAVRTFLYVVRIPEVFADGKLNVELFRDRVFNFVNFRDEFNNAYIMHCKEKICNVVATLNEFRQYTDPKQVLDDIIYKSGLTRFNHCGSTDEYYLMSPRHAGNNYPMSFFSRFLQDNWHKIAPEGVLDSDLLNEYMFNKHERGLRKYGLDAVIRHDYVQDGPCHPEVYFPKRVGSGPVYVETEPRKFIRSCGEGKGPNAIPNYLENMIVLKLVKDNEKYCRTEGYYVPINDLSLPIYKGWSGEKVDFKTIEEKRRFIEELKKRDSGRR